MTRYTARNGTTFLLDADSEDQVKVAGVDDHGLVVSVDLDDLREFVQYLDAGLDIQAPTESDCAGVSAD